MIKIAIVGRPNVGKSALFNAICKKKIAIVDEAEGVTRDRLYAKTDFFGFGFELIDTGGIDNPKKGLFLEEIRRQAEIAIEEADSLIMVVDGTQGLQDIDQEIATILHRSSKPLCLAVNKIDSRTEEARIYNFQALGIEKMVGVSSLHGYHIAELLETALSPFDRSLKPEEETASTKVAILGRPNVGKSTLLNALLGHERSIVSPIAGTTRDSIDSKVLLDDHLYTFIDTAGIRKRHKEREVVEKYAHIRTEAAIERSEICLLVIDVLQGITTEEKKIATDIEKANKGCILLCNKWDAAKGFRMEHALKSLEEDLPFLKHCPRLCISAKSGRNVDKIPEEIQKVKTSMNQRITTGALNKALLASVQHYHPPVIGGKRLRIYYMAQVGTNPPHFVLFVNNPTLMDATYKKYLVNALRTNFGFVGVPLIFQLKPKAPMKERSLRQRGRSPDRDLNLLEEAIHSESEDAS